jgi:hypothetical protein
MTPSPSFAFSSGFHDRASALRTNAEWLSQALQAATTYWWRVRPRIQGDGTPLPWTEPWFIRIP